MPVVAGAHLARAHGGPRHVVAEAVQVGEHQREDPPLFDGQQAGNVLHQQHRWAQDIDRAGDLGPQKPLILAAPPLPGHTHRLARKAGRQHVHGRDGPPVHGGDVAEVRHVRVVGGQHRQRVRVDLGMEPTVQRAEHHPGRHVQAAVAGTQRPAAERHRDPPDILG